MTESKPKLNLIQKLNEASKNIGPIDKDGNNSYQKYKFQSETAIKYAVEGAIRDVGIRIIPSYEVINQYDKEGRKGGSNHYVDVMGTFLITDGVEIQQGSMPGSGQDSGEKAMAKACTSAQKYFYKQLFNITDKDEDPDADDSHPGGGFGGTTSTQASQTPDPEPITPQQKDTLSKLFNAIAGKAKVDLNVVATSFLKQVNGATSMDQLNHKQAQEIVSAATKKLNKLVTEGKETA